MKKNILYLLLLVIIAGVAYWLSNKDTGSTLTANPLKNFAVKDTASISKIFIVDEKNNKITLSRSENGPWMINNQYRVRKHSVNLLLETFLSTSIQSAVPKNMRKTVLRTMANTQRKVMIHGKDGVWLKTWYLGSPTGTNQGTYAILETPNEGLSSEPFIIEKHGFRGYLTSRFHTKVNEWRWKGVFEYPELDIKKISVFQPKRPEHGFSIKVNDIVKNDIELLDQEGNVLEGDLSKIQIYLLEYKNKYLETFDPHLYNDAQEDSIAARIPDFRINVVDKNGVSTKIDLQYKESRQEFLENDPTIRAIDRDRMFGVYKGETIQVQRDGFNSLIIDKEQLMK